VSEPRIALAMVGRPSVSSEVLKHWIEILRHTHWPGPTFHQPDIYAAGAWIGVTPLRNLLTYRALQQESWDAMLWIDSDHIVQVGLFERCVEHLRAGRKLTGGLYFLRNYPFEVQSIGLGPTREEHSLGKLRPVSAEVLVPKLWPPVSEVMEVAGVGTGCMLYSRDIVERIGAIRGAGDIWHVDKVPWEEQIALLQSGQDVSGVMTEDYLFCVDAWELLREPTWLDLDLRMETGHRGEETRGRRHYLAAHTVPPGIDMTNVKLPAGYEAVRHAGTVNSERERTRNQRRLDRHVQQADSEP